MNNTALVLGGGGAKGAYHIGAIKALHELGFKYNIVTGTSIGSLIALILACDNFNKLEEIWKEISFETIIKHKYILKDKLLETLIFAPFCKGFSIEPLEKLVKKHINEDKARNSNIKTGIVITKKGKKYFPVTIDEIPYNELHNYLLTSCSAFPFFKKRKINNELCYDGFYSDNLPVKLAMDMGASKIIAIEIKKGYRKKTDTKSINYLHIKPSKRICASFNFNYKKTDIAMQLGYNDIMNKKEKILEFINK